MALYKYVAPARIDILQDELISFTPPSRLNDAFEMSPLFDKFLDESQVRDEAKKAFNFSYPLAEKVLRRLNITNEEFLDLMQDCAPQELKEKTTPYHKKCFYERIESEYGVLCLSQRPDNLLMWSHYTLAHQGFVIEFDEQHPFFNQKPQIPGVGFLEKVKYSKSRPHLQLFCDITPTEMFFSKSEDWQYEQEWRIVRRLIEKTEERFDDIQKAKICLFEIPSDCIKGIILGCRMSQEDQEKLMDIKRHDKRYSSINLSAAKLSERAYNLDIVPIN